MGTQGKQTFTGWTLWGMDLVPNDLPLSLELVREWAYQKGLIWDEGQLMTKERVEDILPHFSEADQVFILSSVYRDADGKLAYLEYPFLPARTLVKKEAEVRIQWWRMQATATDAQGNASAFGDLHFTFSWPGSLEEFASSSTATIVCEKFLSKFEELASAFDGKRGKEERRIMSLATGKPVEASEMVEVLEIDVGCDMAARFFKTGRKFDVTLTLAPQEPVDEATFLKNVEEWNLSQKNKDRLLARWRKRNKAREEFVSRLKKEFGI